MINGKTADAVAQGRQHLESIRKKEQEHPLEDLCSHEGCPEKAKHLEDQRLRDFERRRREDWIAEQMPTCSASETNRDLYERGWEMKMELEKG
jgi:hypothetical protein